MKQNAKEILKKQLSNSKQFYFSGNDEKKEFSQNNIMPLIIDVVGTAGDDILVGDANGVDSYRFSGVDGDDILVGGDLKDILVGDDGNDQIFGGNGNDLIDGASDNDLLNGGNGNDNILAGLGRDILSGDDGDDVLNGEYDGDDTMDGGNGNDKIYAGRGGSNKLFGGNDNDIIIGSYGDDIIDGGDGDDIVKGGMGEDIIILKTGIDYALGEEGDDLFIVHADNSEDYIDGGKDIDTVHLGYDSLLDYDFMRTSSTEFYALSKITGFKDYYSNIEYVETDVEGKVSIDDLFSTMPLASTNNSFLSQSMAGFGSNGSGTVEGLVTNDQSGQPYLAALVDPKHTV
ncbi:MAG: hypothetical protein K1X44_04035 [Alphaproteobacteria bacterium]|nr:hypothetical protein [Alphaproteobacteria bacterium]